MKLLNASDSNMITIIKHLVFKNKRANLGICATTPIFQTNSLKLSITITRLPITYDSESGLK